MRTTSQRWSLSREVVPHALGKVLQSLRLIGNRSKVTVEDLCDPVVRLQFRLGLQVVRAASQNIGDLEEFPPVFVGE